MRNDKLNYETAIVFRGIKLRESVFQNFNTQCILEHHGFISTTEC